MTHPANPQPATETPLLMEEQGAARDGAPQRSNRRLYLQLQVFTGCEKPGLLVDALKAAEAETVLYIDAQDPLGVGVLFLAEDPTFFVRGMRAILSRPPFLELTRRPELTMFGRTYSSGREQDLEDWLLQKPHRTALNPLWPWAIWYPMRRKGSFEGLPRDEQGKVLFEHAKLGMTYGQADFAHDIRLACHGLDTHDNDFVLGIVGKDLYPLSRIVQDMRKTQQTANHMEALGPFFVGKTLWQSPLKS